MQRRRARLVGDGVRMRKSVALRVLDAYLNRRLGRAATDSDFKRHARQRDRRQLRLARVQARLAQRHA
jgi:hypothetical protein